MKILALDPGESTGWVSYDGEWSGGTITHDRPKVFALLNTGSWDVVVFETFQLYASHARTLIGNKFYTCEIIGLIKHYVDVSSTATLVEQGASVKKYSPAKTSDGVWQLLKKGPGVTNHTFDAYQHMMFYLKNNKAHN